MRFSALLVSAWAARISLISVEGVSSRQRSFARGEPAMEVRVSMILVYSNVCNDFLFIVSPLIRVVPQMTGVWENPASVGWIGFGLIVT